MKPRNQKSDEQVSDVHVNYGRLLEGKLLEWRGGYHHVRGIAEYISNCDDSYRRLKKFHGQLIRVEIHSKSGRKLSKVLIEDFAEGMSLDDLENKFFQYYDSYSGREAGEQVTGRFGTGGKAYAIMNFKHCWITSRSQGLECRFWFKWDPNLKKIIKGYNNGGHINEKTTKPNGTIIELVESLDNKEELISVYSKLEKVARIRHVIKSQNVFFSIYKKNESLENERLEYKSPNPKDAIKDWVFELPDSLKNHDDNENMVVLRYYEKKLNDESFVDLSDGISSVADIEVTKIDGRPFAKYMNGELIIRKLQNSNAVKENRKGLEEGNDLTVLIETFLKDKVTSVIDEIQMMQREKERKRNIEVSNEKIRELNKFLKKCEMNFRNELKELVKKFTIEQETNGNGSADNEESEEIKVFRKPTDEDSIEMLIKGFWTTEPGSKQTSKGLEHAEFPMDSIPKFIPDPEGVEYAVEVGKRGKIERSERKKKSGLQVLMTDDSSIPENERPQYGEYDDPVSDRDMTTKGIIWINANNPIIYKAREKKENEAVFKENVANYVLLVVAQYQTQKVLETQPLEERDDPMILFRQKFFDLQRNLREDKDINYFEEEIS